MTTTKRSSSNSHQVLLSRLQFISAIGLLVTGSITWKLAGSSSSNNDKRQLLLDASPDSLPNELLLFRGKGKKNTNNDLQLPIAVGGEEESQQQQQQESSTGSTTAVSSESTTINPCQQEYERITSNRLQTGLTEIDIENSRALQGNRYRLATLSQKLLQQQQPINAVIAGGSISLGHGVAPTSLRYSNRLEAWMNEYYPINNTDDNNNGSNNQQKQQHRVINYGSHGADICGMAKRLNPMFQRVPKNLDLIVVEFAVNDYQGHDDVSGKRDHKTDAFFRGFEELVTCAEIVVHRLLTEFPNAAIMFLEFQTAILNRKTAAALHMAVAKHYQIPVVSYAETFIPDYHRLINKLEQYDYSTATINNNDALFFTGDPVLPYPHGCVKCQEEHIIKPLRPKGCRSLCDFMSKSGLPKSKDLKCDKLPPNRQPCYVSFLAHDPVHPSAAGHQMAAELIIEAIAKTGREVCEGRQYLPPIMPSLGYMVSDPAILTKRSDFVLVKDTMKMFGGHDQLKATQHSDGFTEKGESMGRTGWMATNPLGNEFVEFTIDLPKKPCYVIYLAVLKSYENMGTFTVQVIDENTNKEITTKVDGLWEPRISIPNDFPVTKDEDQGCTGRCKIRVTTDPQILGRNGNKVKILTLSARECIA